MPIETLVLIPDSTRKRKGSAPGGGPSAIGALSSKDASRLAEMRASVARAAKLPMGPDLDPASGGKVELMPAYLRYDGNMYRHISREAWVGRNEGAEVLIVSALYGLVLSRDLIRVYGFSMAERMPGLGTLHAWWHDGGLPSLLRSCIDGMGAGRVVDLLSLEYRKAVEGYREGLGVLVKAIDFPGMGRASQPRRGQAVAEILLGRTRRAG